MSRAEVFDSHHLPRNGAWGSGVLQAVNTFAEVTSETSLAKTEIQSCIQFFIHSLNIIMSIFVGPDPLPFTLHVLCPHQALVIQVSPFPLPSLYSKRERS